MNPFQSPVTDDDIVCEFDGTNFGPVDHRRILEQAVLQRMVGYHTGHTITQIMIRLGLIADIKHEITPKGRMFLYAAFRDWRGA